MNDQLGLEGDKEKRRALRAERRSIKQKKREAKKDEMEIKKDMHINAMDMKA